MPPALPTDGPVLSPTTDGPVLASPPPPLEHNKLKGLKAHEGGLWQATPVSADSPAAALRTPAAAGSGSSAVGSHAVSITENYATGLAVLDPEGMAPEVRSP